MAKIKYAFVYQLKEPLKKDKLDQILLCDFAPIDFLSSKLIEKDEQGKSTFRSRIIQTKKNSYTCWMTDWFVDSYLKQHLIVILSDKDKLENEVYQELAINPSHSLLNQFAVVYEKSKQKSDGKSFSLMQSIKSLAAKLNGQKDNKIDLEDETPKIEFKPENQSKPADDEKSKRSEEKQKQLETKIDNSIEWIGHFLNSSTRLNQSDLIWLNSNESLAIENGKVVILQKESSQSFEKYLLLIGLASAYGLAIKRATFNLAGQSELKTSQLEELINECKQSLEFIRRYYFDYPLSTNRYDLLRFWEEASIEARLPDLSNEFFTKFDLINQRIGFEKMVNEIKNLPAERVEKQIDEELKIKKLNKLNRNVVIFGSVIALIGLINITPFSINYFFQNWIDIILSFFARVG